MNPGNFFQPAQQHQGPTCPTHGQHQRGWINYTHASNQGAGVSQTFQACGLCVIELLHQLGYLITEPEKLKENEWILDEVPEVKK